MARYKEESESDSEDLTEDEPRRVTDFVRTNSMWAPKSVDFKKIRQIWLRLAARDTEAERANEIE